MRADIGDSTMHYNSHVRNNAIAQLLRFVDKKSQYPSLSGASTLEALHRSQSQKFKNRHHHISPSGYASAPSSAANSATSTPLPSPTSNVWRQRHELVRSMVHEFIRTLLNVDLDVYTYNSLRHYRYADEPSPAHNKQQADVSDDPADSSKQSSGTSTTHAVVNRPRKKSIKELKNPFKKTIRRS
jgi:hypothetical protein